MRLYALVSKSLYEPSSFLTSAGTKRVIKSVIWDKRRIKRVFGTKLGVSLVVYTGVNVALEEQFLSVENMLGYIS
jgi:hypothetical protein